MRRKWASMLVEKQKKETNRINNKCFLLISLFANSPLPYIDEADPLLITPRNLIWSQGALKYG